MRKLFLSIELRVALILMGFVAVGLALFAGTSYAMSRSVLLTMAEGNLNFMNRMRQIQTSEKLDRMLAQTVHMASLQSLQTIYQNPNNEAAQLAQIPSLSQTLDSNLMVIASIYRSNGSLLRNVALTGVSTYSLPTELLPLEANRTASIQAINQTGAVTAGPVQDKKITSLYYMSVTIPVPLSEPMDNFQNETDLAMSQAPRIGYLTTIFSCAAIQRLLGDSAPSQASTGISSGFLAKLSHGRNFTVTLPPLEGLQYSPSWSVIPRTVFDDMAQGRLPSAGLLKPHGDMYSVSQFAFKNLSILLIVHQGRKGVFRQINSLSHMLAIATCCIAIGALMLVVFIAWSGAKPIKKLQEAAKHRHRLKPQDGSPYSSSLSPVSPYSGSNAGRDSESSPPSPTSRRRLTLPDPSDPDQSCSSCEPNKLPDLQPPEPTRWWQYLFFWRYSSFFARRKILGIVYIPDRDVVTEAERAMPDANALDDFEVPGKVRLKRAHLRDELDNISMRFNGMADALQTQYQVLQDRVKTRTKEIEEARRVADEANAAKSHFLARVTHELRTPLNGILGTASLCMDEQSIPEIRTSLKTIFKCGELLLHLLTDLLSFSQNEVDNLVLEEHEFMVSEVMSQLTAIFREQSATAGVELLIDADMECKDLIMFGDINRILQVVFNLLSNSLKFTPSGGSVSFEVYADPIPNRADWREVVFTVKDTGPGIAPHLRKRVFEAFVQGDINTKVRKTGVGLGLSICRQLAERMNGSIVLHSELGHGSEFVFTVPLRYVCSCSQSRRESAVDTSRPEVWPEYELYSADTLSKLADVDVGTAQRSVHGLGASADVSSAQSQAPTSSSSSSADNSAPLGAKMWGLRRPEMNRVLSADGAHQMPDLHILVTDDNKVNQEVMVRMLNLEGLERIQVASDGQDAIDKVKSAMEDGHPFDVVFMDVQMPVLDGRKAAQYLRNEMGVTIPIVAVSAFANEENVQECLEAGMNVFLGKPLRRPSLRKLLHNLLSL